MNTPESNNDLNPFKKPYPQVESLFESLNISEKDREKIQSEFYGIAKEIYENSKWISNDTVRKIKLWESDRESFTIQNDNEWNIVDKYLDFIQSHHDWEKIWRILTTYYNPIA